MATKAKPQDRRRLRAEQLAAASHLQAAMRERRALEETFLKFDGTEVSRPQWGPRGAREIVPSMLVAGDELLDALQAEAEALNAFREAMKS